MTLLASPVGAVLFDLDGTLLDSAPDLAHAANTLRTARGLEALPLALYRPYVGTGARGMLRIALQVTPEDAEFESLKEAFFVAYEQCMGLYSQLFEGVEELLHRLSVHGVQWGIVTNKSERFALPIVKALAPLAAAQVVVGGDTTPFAKPHPQPLLEAALQLQQTSAQCIYVGDDKRDMEAAQAAGMRCVAAAYGYLGDATSLEAWLPDSIIEAPLDLLRVIDLH